MQIQLHAENGSVVLRHRLPLGLTAEQEGARWRAAAEMPDVFDAGGALRGPLSAAIGLMLLFARRLVWGPRATPRQRRKQHSP